jgi:hypothetical protein
VIEFTLLLIRELVCALDTEQPQVQSVGAVCPVTSHAIVKAHPSLATPGTIFSAEMTDSAR